MTISLLQYISDLKTEIKSWDNELTYYINEITLLNDRLNSYLNRNIDEFDFKKLEKFKTCNTELLGRAKKLFYEIEGFNDTLILKKNDNKVSDESFDHYQFFKEKLDDFANDFMCIKDQTVRFTISSL
ncbi:hypothetical protein EI427_08580 [Flammeovirga pectinis]|uniref:Uncharacterized protein n=1 Tax=Flammeovirga pectinis TaxID=2494373 RepID=A0A3S9P278_9BACT|nr:hypothetical protein [Flammeovirga pectinis]AZQ62291.1 hypothetical protein EI427_08580 [Flammeovirga pectinis]